MAINWKGFIDLIDSLLQMDEVLEYISENEKLMEIMEEKFQKEFLDHCPNFDLCLDKFKSTII